MSLHSDPWLDLLVIALAAWAVLVRVVRCTGILPAQHPEPKHSPTDLEAGESFSFIFYYDTLFVLAGLSSPINADGADMTRWCTGRVRHCVLSS